ncbi:hypothetical protein MYSTI_04331 [Myxococcus stipitatus DSM 14675]|uniref:NERD domain-containing protein n=1 Tax=Myxococcus stipitatus (strain DSM 14675 / JCM 12634 / Mx s8) TaxID=1278073 RepID=L7UGQ6_MYXSD|nr:NERD domain-containing protein/DEAD/DEAH box helicase [Myxococcus stipitatus]AGC45629.1 hypothetical protein MYSTI_04331 [Myxococcus stipitatus DSM 14675]
MAILIPDVPKACPNSERYVYERLGRDLPPDWLVLHSLGLGNHEKKIWGEADIVVLSTLGIFTLEVKGGTVECADGVWSFGGDFAKYTKRESPWAQAMGALGAVRNHLCDKDPAFKEVLFGFGVAMPYTTFTVTGTEIIPEVLVDRRGFRQSLKTFVHALENYWKAECFQKHRRNYRGLTVAELRRARQLLRPDVETALSLGGYLTGLEDRLVQLTNEQIRASRRMVANPRTVVRGAAGTGKSVIAFERACQLSAEGHRVLYLCFNHLLASHVRAGIARVPRAERVEVHHVHALYRELIVRAGLLARLDAQDAHAQEFFQKRFPELAIEALCESIRDAWDVLVVDEAQDLLTPEHLDVFDLLVKDGLGRGRWHLFFDPKQNLYGRDVQAQVEERLAGGAPAFDDLYENCRNTRQVAVQASIISGTDLPVTGAPDGPETGIHYYSRPEEGLAALDALVRKLMDSDVRPNDLAILSTRRPDNSLLAGVNSLAGRRLVDPSDEAGLRLGGLLFSTMHSFKGLERQAVIAIDMDEIGGDAWSMLHYAGLSRARCLLHVFLPVSARKSYERQAQAFGRRLTVRGA